MKGGRGVKPEIAGSFEEKDSRKKSRCLRIIIMIREGTNMKCNRMHSKENFSKLHSVGLP